MLVKSDSDAVLIVELYPFIFHILILEIVIVMMYSNEIVSLVLLSIWEFILGISMWGI